MAAVSVGIVKGVPTLDLDYALDSHADADVNVVMTRQHGEMAYAEVQGTGEGRPYRREELNALLDLAQAGVAQLMDRQIEALGEAAGVHWQKAGAGAGHGQLWQGQGAARPCSLLAAASTCAPCARWARRWHVEETGETFEEKRLAQGRGADARHRLRGGWRTIPA